VPKSLGGGYGPKPFLDFRVCCIFPNNKVFCFKNPPPPPRMFEGTPVAYVTLPQGWVNNVRSPKRSDLWQRFKQEEGRHPCFFFYPGFLPPVGRAQFLRLIFLCFRFLGETLAHFVLPSVGPSWFSVFLPPVGMTPGPLSALPGSFFLTKTTLCKVWWRGIFPIFRCACWGSLGGPPGVETPLPRPALLWFLLFDVFL